MDLRYEGVCLGGSGAEAGTVVRQIASKVLSIQSRFYVRCAGVRVIPRVAGAVIRGALSRQVL